jgi:hypothetical protein
MLTGLSRFSHKKCSQNKIIVLVINKRTVKKQGEENPMSEKSWELNFVNLTLRERLKLNL